MVKMAIRLKNDYGITESSNFSSAINYSTTTKMLVNKSSFYFKLGSLPTANLK